MKKLSAVSLLAVLVFLPLGASAEPDAGTPAKPAAEKPAASKTDTAKDTTKDKDDTYRQLKLFGDVFERVRADYVEPVSDEKLVAAALNGMLTDLDPHSSYLSKDEYRDMQVQTRGEFGGLGIEVTLDKGVVKVVSPIDDTPASKAGLQAGDYIVALDDVAVMGMTLQEAVNKMRGTPGSNIKLKVVRGEGEPFDVTVTRAVIRIQSVKSRLEDKVGYLRISSFTDQTQEGLDKAMREIKAKLGDSLQGWVLDLRNNPGGLLDQAVSVSDTFIDAGEIVSTRGRKPEDSDRYNATPGDAAEGKPVVVLINSGSASAAEIVSGALQDHHRAIVLGTKSFGKGSVQTVMPLAGHGAIRLTTARYYTPSGRSIQAEGIVPDIVVEPAKVEKLSEEGFLKEANLPGALKNDNPDAKDATTAATEDPKAQEAELAKKDYQLLRALDLIRGLALYQDTQGSRLPASATTAEAKPAE